MTDVYSEMIDRLRSVADDLRDTAGMGEPGLYESISVIAEQIDSIAAYIDTHYPSVTAES